MTESDLSMLINENGVGASIIEATQFVSFLYRSHVG